MTDSQTQTKQNHPDTSTSENTQTVSPDSTSNSQTISFDLTRTLHKLPFIFGIVNFLLLAVAIPSLYFYTEHQLDQISQEVANSANQPLADVTLAIKEDAVLGDRQQASVGIIEFSDFNCPYCGRYHNQTLPQIKDNYINNNQVAYTYKDFPSVGGQQSRQASNAAECARDQINDQKYYDLLNSLYQKDQVSQETVQKEAKKMVSNPSQLQNCISQGKYTSEVNADLDEGSSAGITGTPGFVIGRLNDKGEVAGEVVSGAQRYPYFERLIQKYMPDEK
jgi:protein-disulfide isomerase